MKTTLKSTLKALLTLTFILTLLLNGTAFAQSAFDQTAAENLALEAAGATRERALLFPTEIETEHGQTAYDVEFRCDGFEYEYWISTTDGAIIKRAWALTSQKTLEMAAYQDAAAIVIGEQQALDKALADAGLTEADITLLEISLDTDDMLRLYEIEFYTATAEYDYDVDAVSGTVCGASIEYFAENETVRPGQQPASPETVASAQGISREKARSIALSDASLSAADVTFTKTKLDREDGMLVYEIEFVTAAAEYEYEIDAVTGAIRERSIETRATAQPAASSYIGVDQAKSIALKHAGLSAAEVSFTKAKLEKDDGLRKYEIEFIKGSTEYEYEIDAATGSVLEYDVERSEPAPSNDNRQPDRDDDHDDDRDDDHDDDDDDDDEGNTPRGRTQQTRQASASSFRRPTPGASQGSTFKGPKKSPFGNASSKTPEPVEDEEAPQPPRRPAKGVYALVIYDFPGTDEDELPLREGQKVRVTRQHPSGWWTGEINGKIGIFPATYVKLL